MADLTPLLQLLAQIIQPPPASLMDTVGGKQNTVDESAFQRWYAAHASKLGLSPNPDDPEHYYDWRAAFQAGAAPDASGHWPSQFKREGHPNLIINGVDTRTGMPPQDDEGSAH